MVLKVILYHNNWEKIYCPWANFCLDNFVNVWNSEECTTTIINWTKRSLKGKYLLTMGAAYFELEEDLILFSLRWL